MPAGEAVEPIDRFELLGGDVPLRPLGISEILDAAITGIRTNPRAILGLSLIVATVINVVVALASFFLTGDQAGNEVTPGVVMRLLGAQAVLITLSTLLTAYGIVLLSGLLGPVLGRTLFGLPASFRQAWRDALPAAGRLVAVASLIFLFSVGAAALCALPVIFVAVAGGPAAAGIIFGLVGLPAGFVLMVWLYVRSVLAAPAVILERESIPGALTRVRVLSRGRWWRICGTLLLTLLITVFAGFILQAPFIILQLAIFGSDPTGLARVLSLGLLTFGKIVSSALTIPFDAGVIALLYIDLRMRREGIDLDVQTRPDAELRGPFLDLWRPPHPGMGRTW
jgi:hypothetical protein